MVRVCSFSMILFIGALIAVAAPDNLTPVTLPFSTESAVFPSFVGNSGSAADATDEVFFFENFESGALGWRTVDYTGQSSWHKDDFNAYGGSGMSWWVGDTLLSGYDNSWLQYLESPSMNMIGAVNPILEFDAFWAIEGLTGGYPPGYNGWDGANVWVSTDDGVTWSVLPVQSPPYSATSLGSFGVTWGFGTGIPGWAGFSGESAPGSWVHVTASMADYTSATVKLRFALASDEEICTRNQSNLTGFFVDNINVHGGTMTYLLNNGEGLAIPREMNAVSGMGNVGNFWHIEQVSTPPPPSGTHVMRLSQTSTSYPQGLNNAVITPRIDLESISADTARIFADFYIYGSINQGSPYSWPNMDYWTVQISPDNGLNWYYYSNPWDQGGPNRVWIQAPGNYSLFSNADGQMINLSPYAGHTIQIRILFRSNNDSYNGAGLFVDNFMVFYDLIPNHDAASQNLWIPMPTSEYFPQLHGFVDVANMGMQMENSIPLYWRLGSGDPIAIEPFPSLAPGNTQTITFSWTPTAGSYNTYAYTALSNDLDHSNDTTHAGIIEITNANVLEFGYDNRQYSYMPSYNYFEFASGTGACVRFTPMADGVVDSLRAVSLKALFNNTGQIRVHIFEAGTAQAPGPETDQFDADVTLIAPQWQSFDLSNVTYLQNNRTDFWVWLEVVNSATGAKVTGSRHLLGDSHFFSTDGSTFTPSDYDFFIRTVMEPTTSVSDPGANVLPTKFDLGQNHPNPFNPTTIIPYALPRAAQVELSVFDVRGEQVDVIFAGHQAAGNHQINFNASRLSSGIYLYRLKAGDFVAVGKMVLLK